MENKKRGNKDAPDEELTRSELIQRGTRQFLDRINNDPEYAQRVRQEARDREKEWRTDPLAWRWYRRKLEIKRLKEAEEKEKIKNDKEQA